MWGELPWFLASTVVTSKSFESDLAMVFQLDLSPNSPWRIVSLGPMPMVWVERVILTLFIACFWNFGIIRSYEHAICEYD